MLLYCIIGFLAISLVGSGLHFVYDWLNHNKIISLFVAVNESTWEHLKLAAIPTFIWGLTGHFLRFHNIEFATFAAVLTVCVVIPLIFYTYKYFTKKSILFIDIASFFVAVAIAMTVAYFILSAGMLPHALKIIGIVGNVLMIIMFFVFTYFPPKIFLFQDPITKKYGLEGHADDEKYAGKK